MELADLYRNNCQYEDAELTIQQSLKAIPQSGRAQSFKNYPDRTKKFPMN
jgi:hypothetical protein